MGTFVTSGLFAGTPILLDAQTIVTGANDDTVHLLHMDGSLIQSLGPLGDLENGLSFLHPITVANDGTMTVPSADSNIYFISTDPTAKPCQ